MENFDITQVPNSVLIATSIKELYFQLVADYDHDYRNRIELFTTITGKSDKAFKKRFHGEYFYTLDDVEVCNIAINFLEFMLKHDVTLRLETAEKALKIAEKNKDNSPEVKQLEREEFLLWWFNDDKKKFLKYIELVAKKLNNPQNANIYIICEDISNEVLAISDRSVVLGSDETYYIEGNEKWAEIDKRLDALKRELSTIVQDGV